MHRTIILLLMTLGCDPFANWPDDSVWVIEDELWDPDVVPTTDGVYVRLPYAGLLARVQSDGSHTIVDMDGAAPTRLIGTPDGERVLVLAEWPVCDDPDPEITLVEGCPSDALSTEYEWVIVKGGKRTRVTDVPTYLNRVDFTPDGQMAVLHMTADADVPTAGVINPTQVVFLSMIDGQTHSVSVGAQPTGILFSDEGDSAIVLSESEVVVVEMDEFTVQTRYPLTLDADQEIEPAGASLSPDGRYALVAVTGSSDLFQLDLETASIDLEALDDEPSDLSSDPVHGTTVVTYSDLQQVDVITEHGFIERSRIDLEETAPRIAMGNGFAVLYDDTNGTNRDIYRLDLDTLEVTEYVAANPVHALHMTESSRTAVAVLRPDSAMGEGDIQDSHWGLAIIDLASNDIANLILESEPVGVALVESEQSAHALVLMDGVEALVEVDLDRPGEIRSIDLTAPPAGIAAMPDGRFVITHDRSLGLISFLDPKTQKVRTAGRFAASGLLTDHPLPRRTKGKE